MFTILSIFLSIYFVYAAPAFAYLDPGAGGFLLQGVIAALATASVAITMGWQRIKKLAGSLWHSLRKHMPDAK